MYNLLNSKQAPTIILYLMLTRAVNVSTESLTDVMNELGMTEGFDVGL
jgi:hypothetical protein